MLITRGRVGVFLFAVLTLVAFAGCGDKHESALDDSIDLREELAGILEGITDEASAKAASSKIEGWVADQKKLSERMESLDEPSAEEGKAMQEKYQGRMAAASARLHKQMQRLMMNPKLAPAIGEAMGKIQAAMQK